jgi:hypothetical protein
MNGFAAVGIVSGFDEDFAAALPINDSRVFPFGKIVNRTTEATRTAGMEIRYVGIPVEINKIIEK